MPDTADACCARLSSPQVPRIGGQAAPCGGQSPTLRLCWTSCPEAVEASQPKGPAGGCEQLSHTDQGVRDLGVRIRAHGIALFNACAIPA